MLSRGTGITSGIGPLGHAVVEAGTTAEEERGIETNERIPSDRNKKRDD